MTYIGKKKKGINKVRGLHVINRCTTSLIYQSDSITFIFSW